MNDILSFGWADPTSLGLELSKPIQRVSIEFEPHGKPASLTLWRQDGTGLRLCSTMHDVAERTEVGVLQFERVSSAKEGEIAVEIASEFRDKIAVSKLVVQESGIIAESGIVLTSSNDSEIVVVAADFPYFLAIQGLLPEPYTFRPEYPLERYSRVPLT